MEAHSSPERASRLQRTLEVLLGGKEVCFQTVPPAHAAAPGKDELFIGVGLSTHGGEAAARIYSRKHGRWPGARSSLSTVFASAAALDAVGEAHTLAPGAFFHSPLTLVLPSPTLDTVFSCLLAVHRLLWREWPIAEGAQRELESYVSDWEEGRVARAGRYRRGLAPVFYAIQRLTREGTWPAKALLEFALGVLELEPERAMLRALPLSRIPDAADVVLRADEDHYRAELSRARRVQLDIPVDLAGNLAQTDDASSRRVDALFLSSFQDVTVLKLLCRRDREHSSYGRGFELMAIHVPEAPRDYLRHTISFAYERPGNLANLAALLDEREGPLAPDGTPRKTEGKRFAAQPNAYGDPWYTDGYLSAQSRSTIVAPPSTGTRLSREEIWETVWGRFNPGRNIHIARARSLFVRPFRMTRDVARALLSDGSLLASGWSAAEWPGGDSDFLPAVTRSFIGRGGEKVGDVRHYVRDLEAGTSPAVWTARKVHLSLYPNQLALIWIEGDAKGVDLFTLASRQAELAGGEDFAQLAPIAPVVRELAPLSTGRWQVFGSYAIDRSTSTIIDEAPSVQGLLHALSSGTSPTLGNLPPDGGKDAHRVLREASGDIEHWLTSTGGARFRYALSGGASLPPVALDEDFQLFLITLGQRYSVFEIHRRMSEIERTARTSTWQSLNPVSDLRADVMLFTNSLWYTQVSDQPAVNARYGAWLELHGTREGVEAMRDQVAELDEYRKQRREATVNLLLLIFLPITIVCGFFSGLQFEQIPLEAGLPWTTSGWILFLAYTVVFTALIGVAFVGSKLLSRRR